MRILMDIRRTARQSALPEELEGHSQAERGRSSKRQRSNKRSARELQAFGMQLSRQCAPCGEPHVSLRGQLHQAQPSCSPRCDLAEIQQHPVPRRHRCHSQAARRLVARIVTVDTTATVLDDVLGELFTCLPCSLGVPSWDDLSHSGCSTGSFPELTPARYYKLAVVSCCAARTP